jgi:hypothetical protein
MTDKRLARCVYAVCRMPIEFHRRNISMVGLIDETGYVSLAGEITQAVLEEHLRQHPELVAVWVQYSEDQRCSPAYGLGGRDTVGDPTKDWHVSYWDPHDPTKCWDRIFPDQFAACAIFIKCEAGSLADLSSEVRDE